MADLLVLLLIVFPLPLPSLPVVPRAMHAALHRVAVVLELTNPNTTWTARWPFELAWCRCAHRAASGCPPAADVLRFPSAGVAKQQVRFGEQAKLNLELRQSMSLHRWHEYSEALTAVNRCLAIWAAVESAAGETIYPVHRRRALGELRGLLGYEAYFAGTLPTTSAAWVELVD